MKTVYRWLSELPEPIRSEALANVGDTPAYNAGQALRLAFNWANSPQGFEYWEEVCKNLEPKRKYVRDWLDMFHPHMQAEYHKLVEVSNPKRLADALGLVADTFSEAVTKIWWQVAMQTPYRHTWHEFREKCLSTQYCVDKASDIPIPEIREEVLSKMIHQAALCGSYESAILTGGMNPSHYDPAAITQENYDLLEHYEHNFVTKENLQEHKEMLKRIKEEKERREELSARTDLPF